MCRYTLKGSCEKGEKNQGLGAPEDLRAERHRPQRQLRVTVVLEQVCDKWPCDATPLIIPAPLPLEVREELLRFRRRL